jgi:hypothetical protein
LNRPHPSPPPSPPPPPPHPPPAPPPPGNFFPPTSDIVTGSAPLAHAYALAIYVTGGKSNHKYRFEKIGSIARAVYDGYQAQWPAGRGQVWTNATYAAPGN